MAHTNSTTNYSLPQFITTDKPAWLTDINGAFSDIDTAIHNAQDKADTAYNNAATAQGDATTAINNAAAADAKGAGAVASLADTFDPTTVYSVGAIVMYNSLLYKCTVAVITPSPWTGSANWSRLTVEDMFTGINGATIPLGSSSDVTTVAGSIRALQTDTSNMAHVLVKDIVIGSVTAGTKYDLFNLNTLTGGVIPDFSALKGLMYLGGGGNANSYGYLFCNPITSVVSYIPQVTDTSVKIYLALLY